MRKQEVVVLLTIIGFITLLGGFICFLYQAQIGYLVSIVGAALIVFAYERHIRFLNTENRKLRKEIELLKNPKVED